MNKYEVMYILLADQAEDDIAAQIEKFSKIVTDNGGNVTEVKAWGKRRLAYPINYKNEGYYVLMHFDANASFPAELERNFKIDEHVIRFLVTRMEE